VAERPLVFLELVAGEPTRGSLGLLGRAREVFGTVAAVVFGPHARTIGGGLGGFGADTVYTFDENPLGREGAAMDLAWTHVDAVAHLVEEHGFRTVLFEGSSVASDIAGALSARLEAGVNWALSDISLNGEAVVGIRPSANEALRAGGGRVRVGWVGPRHLGVFETDAFAPRRSAARSHVIDLSPVVGPTGSGESRRAVRVVSGTTGDDPASRALGSADVIVAGGRGMRDASVLRTLEELAELLGGAVGVSMPIVDRGWYPYEHQIGSATPSVRPRIYIACGISGSVQHRIGMQQSQFVVAINIDRDAPIMSFADVGVLGDLHQLLPQLIELLRRHDGAREPEPTD